MKTGIYQMKAEKYHADPCERPSLSNSMARTLISESPLHAWVEHPRLNPNFTPKEDAKFDRGSASHALLLEGEDRMHVINAKDFRTNAAKELRDAARAIGKFPILEAEYDAVYEMVRLAKVAIAQCPDLGGITLKDGTAEDVLIWERDGVQKRSRLDWRKSDGSILLDYKTTEASANPAAWERTLLNAWGDMQPAFYLEGNEATGGPQDAKFIWLVQEVTPPYACAFIGATTQLLELGRQKCAAASQLWRQCLESGHWPAYSNRIHWLTPPAWAEAKWNDTQTGPLDPDGLPNTDFLRKDEGSVNVELGTQI